MIHIIRILVPVILILSVTTGLQNAAIDYEISDQEIVLSQYNKDLIGEVDVTMYEPLRGQTDSTPNIVADGTRFDIPSASDLKWIAVSRDLHRRWGGLLHFGDIVYLSIPDNPDKTGYYLVKDTMNARWRDRIDILESPGHPLYKYRAASLFVVKPQGLSRDHLWSHHLGP